MPLEAATYVSQLVPANPPGTDPRAQGDDHIRLIKAVLQATFPNVGEAVDLRSAVMSRGAMIATQDWNLLVKPGCYNTSIVGTMPNRPTLTHAALSTTGITVVFGAKPEADGFPLCQVYIPATGTAFDDAVVWRCNIAGTWSAWNRVFTTNGGGITGPINQLEASIAAAATLNLSTASSFVVTHAAGTVNITSLNGVVVPAGAIRYLRMSISGGTVTLVHNATSLQLPGGQNLPLSDKDELVVRSLGSGNWKLIGRVNATTPINSGVAGTAVLITAAGNFVVPAGIFVIKATLTGPGGGGAGALRDGTANAQQSGGGAGGAGETRIGIMQVVPGASLAYAPGTPGSGGASGTAPSDGTDGTNATFNGLTAVGGKRGRAGVGTNDGGDGGTGGSGGIGIPGGGGGAGKVAFGSNGPVTGGNGGSSFWGGGPRSFGQSGLGPSTVGAYGSGGPGGCSRAGADTAGQPGKGGCLYIEY